MGREEWLWQGYMYMYVCHPKQSTDAMVYTGILDSEDSPLHGIKAFVCQKNDKDGNYMYQNSS